MPPFCSARPCTCGWAGGNLPAHLCFFMLIIPELVCMHALPLQSESSNVKAQLETAVAEVESNKRINDRLRGEVQVGPAVILLLCAALLCYVHVQHALHVLA